MAATFVNVTEDILKQLVQYFLSNNNLCNYTEIIILLSLRENWEIISSTLSQRFLNNILFAYSK